MFFLKKHKRWKLCGRRNGDGIKMKSSVLSSSASVEFILMSTRFHGDIRVLRFQLRSLISHSLCLSLCLFVHLSVCLSTSSYVFLPIFLSVYVCMSYMSIYLSIHMSVRLFVCLSMSVCLSVYVCLPACLSKVCLVLISDPLTWYLESSALLVEWRCASLFVHPIALHASQHLQQILRAVTLAKLNLMSRLPGCRFSLYRFLCFGQLATSRDQFYPLLDQILQTLWPYTRLKLLNCSWFRSFVSDPVKQDPILDQFFMITKPYIRLNGLKTIPFPVAHTRITNIWEYSPPGLSVGRGGGWKCKNCLP